MKLKKNVFEPLLNYMIYARGGRKDNYSIDELRMANISFSQFGEDLAILSLLNRVNLQGYWYIDIGAFHPIQYSNTLLLHKKGLKGLNVDLDERKIELFKKYRSNDINVVGAISEIDDERYVKYTYPESTTNRILKVDELNNKSLLGEQPLSTEYVYSKSLGSLISELNIPNNIALLNIDVEGMDFKVLKGFSFTKIQPMIICIECGDSDKEIVQYLKGFNYREVCELGVSKIFKRTHNQIRK